MSNRTAYRAVQMGYGRDTGRSFLPSEHPLDMPTQDFDLTPHAGMRDRSGVHWATRAALIGGAVLLTVGFCRELYAVLSFVQITPFQIVFLVLSTLAFGWIALGSLSAAIGLMPLLAGGGPIRWNCRKSPNRSIGARALLFPSIMKTAPDCRHGRGNGPRPPRHIAGRPIS